MSLNNLRNYNWEQGTLSNPVSLTGIQFSWLINLLKKGTVTKDIRGYIQVGSPITSYEKYLVELAKDEHNQPLLHLVNPTVTPVEYTVVPQASTIKEGTSTKLNINGIGLEALKFRIVNHTNDTPDYQARTTIDTKLGYVIVAPAQENATWTDVVTIQACPVWEEWSDQSASIVEFDVTVNAVAVTSVTITAPQYVKPGVTFNPIVNFLPVVHTKAIVNTLEDAGAKRGICFIPTSDNFTVGKTTDPTKMSAIAPNTETPVGETWSLGCGVYAFTSTQTMATPSVNVAVKYPYIQFTVTTDGTFSDISTANPKITLQKVDSEDTPIGEPVVLTGTVSGSSLVYTYGGGAVAGDGSETYKINIENVRGYTTPNIVDIIPNGVITEISASYTVIVAGIYVLYSDGTLENADETINRGSAIQGKSLLGLRCMDAYVDFVMPFREFMESEVIVEAEQANPGTIKRQNWDYTMFVNSPSWSFKPQVTQTLELCRNSDIELNTRIFMNGISPTESERQISMFHRAYDTIFEYGGVQYHGYVGDLSHYIILLDNMGKYNTLMAILGINNMIITNIDIATSMRNSSDRSFMSIRKEKQTDSNNNIKGAFVNAGTTDKWFSWTNYIDPKLIPIYFVNF